MALQIINGKDNKGLEVAKGFEVAYDFLVELASGNTIEDQQVVELNAVLGAMETVVDRIEGQPLPVKEHNVKFTKGGVQTSAKEFQAYWSKFEMEKSQGYNVQAFDYSDETLFEFKNLGVDVMEKVMDATSGIRGAYINSYLPYIRLKAMITGASTHDSLPAFDNGTGKFTTSFGFARGESYDAYLPPSVTTKTVNLYRTIKANTGVAPTDIRGLINAIKNTKSYGKGGGMKGILVIGAYDTIQGLASLANAPENKDIEIFGTVTNMYNANFKAVEGMSEDFLIAMDMSYMNKLLVRGVNKDPEQRGLVFIPKNEIKTFKTYEDITGGKMRIWEEEYYMPYRLSAGILCTNTTAFHSSGLIQAGSTAETLLKAWVANITSDYEDAIV